LCEPNTATAAQIDGWDNVHADILRMAEPTMPLLNKFPVCSLDIVFTASESSERVKQNCFILISGLIHRRGDAPRPYYTP